MTMRSRIFFAIRYIAMVWLFLAATITIYAQTSHEDTVSVTATVAQDNIVIFSGDACPSCQVFLLLGGSVADSTISQGDGSFQLDIQDIDPITHQFGIYAIDQNGIHSGTSTFSVDVSQGAIIYISDILISPTLRANSAETEQGNDLVLSGYTVPNGEVMIEIDGASTVVQVNAAIDGEFFYALDTTSVQIGSHYARAFVQTATDTSGYSLDATFEVVEKVESDEDEDGDDDEEETPITISGPTIEQQIEQIEKTPPTGKAVDFAVVVANENSRVSSGEYLELRVVIIHVREDFLRKAADLKIKIEDSSGVQLYDELYKLDLEEGQRLSKRIKIRCPEKEGDFAIRAEILVDEQRINEEAVAQISKGGDCKVMKTGLETSLINQNVGLVSWCGYIDWLIALLVVLLIVILILIILLLSKKKEEEKDLIEEEIEKEGSDE